MSEWLGQAIRLYQENDFVLLACKCQKHGKETSTGTKMHTIPEQF